MKVVTNDLIPRLTEAGLTPDILQPNDQPLAEPKPQSQSVVLLGLPFSLIGLHEYLARLSSYPNPSLSILVLDGRTPRERYVLRYPAVYQHRWLVDLPLCFNHPLLAPQHLVCAAAELALQAGERYAGLSGLSEMIKQLANERAISRKTATRQWVATPFQPHRRMRLRFFEPAFAVIRQPDRRFITSLAPQRAFREAFEGAIYHHQGESFHVERYLAERRRITVRPVHNSDQTGAQIEAHVGKKHINVSLSAATYHVSYGTLTYTESIRTFERRTKQNPAHVSRYALPNHQRQFQTAGVWFDFDDNEAAPKQAHRTAIHTFIPGWRGLGRLP
jgi:DEAD/DEAH box helicase domain-containing protein